MRHFLVVPGIICLAMLGTSRAQANPVFANNESGSGLLRVANHNDQGVNNASVVLDSGGYFQLTIGGSSSQGFGGRWHNSGPGVYDLDVSHGFGPYGANGSGRLIASGGVLRQFEIGGETGNSPFYLSFGAGGYSCPQPASDGFALDFSLGGPGGYFYGQPHYANHGHYHGGHGPNVQISVQNNTYVNNRNANNQGNGRAARSSSAGRARPVSHTQATRANHARPQQVSHTRQASRTQPAARTQQVNRTQQAAHAPRPSQARTSHQPRPAVHVQQVSHAEQHSGGDHVKKQ